MFIYLALMNLKKLGFILVISCFSEIFILQESVILTGLTFTGTKSVTNNIHAFVCPLCLETSVPKLLGLLHGIAIRIADAHGI